MCVASKGINKTLNLDRWGAFPDSPASVTRFKAPPPPTFLTGRNKVRDTAELLEKTGPKHYCTANGKVVKNSTAANWIGR